MHKFVRLSLMVSLFLIKLASIQAATCSCAGVPLSDTINLTAVAEKELLFSLSYNQSDISHLVSGRQVINDETGRKRDTQNYLAQFSYGISDNWSITSVVSWVEHSRNITTSNTVEEKSSGIGDSLIVIGYAPQKIDPFTQHEWAFGLGIRLPTGKDDNGSPITFAEDLQPGQGAWGSSVWFHYAYAFNQQADWLVFVDSNMAKNGRNSRHYSFEKEWNLSTGTRYQINERWSSAVSITHKNATAHSRFGVKTPNTGGSWLNFTPSIQYSLSPTTHFNLSATKPLSRNLNGALQFTTKNSFAVSISHQFN